MLAVFVLVAALGILCGTASTALAMAQQSPPASGCCPAAPGGEGEGADPGLMSECQCLSWLTLDHQQPLALAGPAGIDPLHHETTATLTGGNYRTIDYPPERA